MNKTTLVFFAAIAWFLISIILLTIPGTAFPQEDWLDQIWFDKWVHVGMFALLVVLWCLALKLLRKDSSHRNLLRAFVTIAIIFAGYGIIMEFIQKNFVPFRSFDFGDIVSDVVGCTAGLIFSIRRYIKK
ncbi:MAG: VanZ family protein [Chitinophagales bacterium]